MALAHLRIRVSHLLLALGGAVVLIAAVLGGRALWSASKQQQQQVEADREHLRDQPGSTQPPRFRRGFFPGAKAGADNVGEGVAVFEPPPVGDPGDLGPSEAVASFQAVLAELETAANDDRRLSPQERAEFYNRATGSFTAMTAWADPSDPNERARMDDAYAQMLALMHELGIEPPPVDPDRSTFRR